MLFSMAQRAQKNVKITSERWFHLIRWILVLGWLLLIASLFYDPISAHWTASGSGSWLADARLTAEPCVKVQGVCLPESPYPIANRVFWGMVVPSAILIVLLLGHEVWRRICPLYFLSQIPRALGLKPLLDVQQNLWLQRNHFYLQFGLFFLGLNVRILLVNSSRIALGIFLMLTISAAIATIALYGGRSWCHYVCPFGMVQTVFTGPRGLLGSKAHTAPAGSITQSMCRTVSRTSSAKVSQEQTTCISCKSSCLDIDAEKSYWNHINKPGRRLVQYGYLGLVLGYVSYYWLYAGNSNYYFSGAWTHEPNQLGTLLKPGLYIAGQAINIPKVVAAPLTLFLFAALGYIFGTYLEMFYRRWLQRSPEHNFSREQIRHRVFSLCTFLAFNLFFVYGGRPEINRLSLQAQLAIQTVIAAISVLWLCRVWMCSPERYNQESIADKLRRQLRKLPLNLEQFLEGRSLDSLTPAEVQILAQTLPVVTQQDRLELYRGVLRDALQTGLATTRSSIKLLNQLRLSFRIDEEQHDQFLSELMGSDVPIVAGGLAAGARSLTNPAQSSAMIQSPIPRTVVRRPGDRLPENPTRTTSPMHHEPTRIRPNK